jgi:tripartite-type tricarboxylate transporter receptor subunit TctC
MSILRRDLLQMASVASLLSAAGQQAWAQAQLESLKIVTGCPPGGTSDAICRRVAEKIAPSAYTKAAFVENKSGAGGQIAVQFVRNAPADGATLLQTPMSMLGIYPHIYKKLPYDPVGDLATRTRLVFHKGGFCIG